MRTDNNDDTVHGPPYTVFENKRIIQRIFFITRHILITVNFYPYNLQIMRNERRESKTLLCFCLFLACKFDGLFLIVGRDEYKFSTRTMSLAMREVAYFLCVAQSPRRAFTSHLCLYSKCNVMHHKLSLYALNGKRTFSISPYTSMKDSRKFLF